VAVLVKRILRAAAAGFVVHGVFALWLGEDRDYARFMLGTGLWCALLFLWLDWRDRRH
jgi:hypothetical protein